MLRAQTRRLVLIAGTLALGLPGPAAAQSGTYDRYLNHNDLTAAVRGLVGSHGNVATLSSLAKTDAGRDVWLLTLGRRQGRDVNTRPALLIVANLEGNHLIGSSAALFAAEHLLTQYGRDAAITTLLDERTVYVIPRASPDGAELAFSLRGHETPYKPFAGDASTGGLNAREMGRDLNGDGLVTLMRVRDPAGDMIADSLDARVLRRAERARAERGMWKVMVEGIDPDNIDAYVPVGSDGVNLNRNFQHEYLYFQQHVGPHMISEVESRALADFVHDRENIAAVLTYSFYDNLRSPPAAQRTVPQGVTGNPPNVPTNILPQDRPFFEYVSGRFQSVTGLRGEGADNEAGSFPQFVYYHLGLPSFTTPVWTLPPAPTGGQGRAVPSRDARWLSYMDSLGVDGFVQWTPARHPTLGDVEVGGFRPNARTNPPASQIRELAEKHTEFAVWLGQQLPAVEVVETKVEPRGDNVFLVTAVIANEQYLPTQLFMGQRIRFNRPITVRLMPAQGVTILTGNPQQQVPRLEGMGGRSTFTWLVQAPAGTRIDMEIFAERAGGLMSTPLTLR
ncbi:M14 family metallopeptidase [soil metagenome]